MGSRPALNQAHVSQASLTYKLPVDPAHLEPAGPHQSATIQQLRKPGDAQSMFKEGPPRCAWSTSGSPRWVPSTAALLFLLALVRRPSPSPMSLTLDLASSPHPGPAFAEESASGGWPLMAIPRERPG